MRVTTTRPLFDWEALEDSPSLKTIRLLLEAVPDSKLLQSLERARGRGRDDYPVHVLWGVVLVTPILRHASIQACLDELRRNASLRRLIGIDSESGVPKKWNVSRFLRVLGKEPHLSLLRETFDAMARRLVECVPDLGKHTAGDATGLSARLSRSKKRPSRSKRRNSKKDLESLPPPSGGRKEYTDAEGHVTHAVEWFGYKLHLVVDVKHEVALAYKVTSTKSGDGETLPTLLEEARSNLPAGRIETLAYDKAADTRDVHKTLARGKIKAVIENRSIWKDDHERMLPGHDGASNVVYDEAGTVFCYDRVSDPIVRHQMSYVGHEPRHGTLKYRCPAVHEGWKCRSHTRCNAGRAYGKTVRVKQEIDFRRFPAIPRATKKFHRLYKGRTAVERVNGRLKLFWGADDGNISGAERFYAFLGTVMVAHLAFATVLASLPRRNTLGRMQLGLIARRLQKRLRP